MNRFITTLNEIGDWGSGGTPLSSKPEFYNGSIPWLIIEDLNDDIVIKSKKTITEMGLKNSSAKMVDPNTLLIAMYGSIGKLGIAGIKCATNQAIAFCKLNNKIADVWFVFYYLLFSRPLLLLEGRGNTQQNISQSFLKDYPIPLPSLNEQRRIASILKKADRLRQLRRYARQLSDGYLQSVFLEMFGDPTTNPNNFEIIELKEVCKKITDGTHLSPNWADKGIPFLFVSNIVDGRIDFNTRKYISFETWNDLNRRCPIEVNDILYTIVGSYGNAAIVETDKLFSFQRHIAHIKPDSNKILARFLVSILQTSFVRKQADLLVNGVAQKTLNLKELETIKIFTPPVTLQNEFIAVKNKFEIIKKQQLESERQTEMHFQSLLQRAFQGELQ